MAAISSGWACPRRHLEASPVQGLVLFRAGPDRHEMMRLLRQLGVEPRACAAPEEAVRLVRRLLIDIVVVEAGVLTAAGARLLADLGALEAGVPILAVTDDRFCWTHGGLPGAHEWIGGGEAQLRLGLTRALEHRRLTRRLEDLERDGGDVLDCVAGTGAAAGRFLRALDEAGATEYNVVLYLEDGLGDELAARRLHCRSARACAGFVEVEAEGAGAGAGAAVGAGAGGRGPKRRAEEAYGGVFPHGGTLFLRGLHRFSAREQAGVMSALREREVAGERPRLVASMTAAPEDLVGSGKLRADLFRMLSELVLRVEPLRSRPEDLARLCRRYLREAALDLGKPLVGFNEEAMDLLLAYGWPGNSVEARTVVRRAATAAEAVVGRGHLQRAGVMGGPRGADVRG